MPPDLLQLPPFGQLSSALGGKPKAVMAWWVLFCQLNYLEQEGSPCGRVPEQDIEQFKKTVNEMGVEAGVQSPQSMVPSPESDGKTLYDLFIGVKLLKMDGPDIVCPRYQALNSGDRFGKSLSSIGGSMKAFRKKQGKLDAEAMQQSLNILESKFVDEDGVALLPDLVQRVTRLIIACDHALYKSSRPPFGFTEGLIQTALGIVRAKTDEEIDYVCEQVALHRAHPRLAGLTTERLLPQFGDMVRTVAQ